MSSPYLHFTQGLGSSSLRLVSYGLQLILVTYLNQVKYRT